ncbi:M1 family metallopeptidase [Flavobacterium cheonanense]|uniref:M1 family metallopeptidase n=1 Tax=Flavobacterium cheonanense TaxID=706183 RepID=A0ABP7VRV6_9FLAO
MKKIFIIGLTILGFQTVFSQNFTRRDSLQGGLRLERTCYDVQRYDLNIKINPDEKSIVGYNEIAFKVVENSSKIQIDLFENMQIDSIIHNNKKLEYKREFDAVFIDFPSGLTANSSEKIRFYYSGKPKVAKNAPWDGGFVFKKDKQGKHWIGVAVQGTGASLWYPVKDSQTDEPDLGSTIKVAVPNGLMNVSNGRFKGSEDLKNGYTRWDWEVKNPINNYDITVNIADYAHIHDNHNGLDLDYYVLRDNEEIAKKHFEEVKPMMDCFQTKFGKYPFAEDGYKLVETPYLGMEHQSAVAYGNKYKKGYMGSDLSMSGVGLLFDYITIHESGHEWFGNSITSSDIADMWIHEGFTQYTELVYIECQFGYEKAMKYAKGLKLNVRNDRPIIGTCCVNNEGSGDMYPKGALLLNTLRHVINNDELWWKIILKYSETYRHKIIDTPTVIAFFNKESSMNLTPIFNQYLSYKKIPAIEIKLNKKKLEFQWKTDVSDFNMPIDIKVNGKEIRIEPTNKWKKSKFKIKSLDEVEVLNNEFFVHVWKL